MCAPQARLPRLLRWTASQATCDRPLVPPMDNGPSNSANRDMLAVAICRAKIRTVVVVSGEHLSSCNRLSQ